MTATEPFPQHRAADLSVAQLHAFGQVMRFGGYAAAAKHSHLSVPSVWQHVQAVEKAYGVRLFERRGRQVQATDAAHRLHEHLQNILVQLDSTFELLQTSSANSPVRLVTGARMMLEELAEPLAKFQSKFANPISIQYGNEQRAEQLLLSDEADLALALEPAPDRRSALIQYEPAYTVDFLAICALDHTYATERSPDLRKLAKHPLVVTALGSHGRDALNQALHRTGLSAKIAVETDNSAFTIACVAAGMGVGILAGRSGGKLCQHLATRSLSEQLGQRRIVLMWRKGRLLTEPLLELVEQCKALNFANETTKEI